MAAIQLNWSALPIASLHKEGLHYQRFYAELANSLHTEYDENHLSSTVQNTNAAPHPQHHSTFSGDPEIL